MKRARLVKELEHEKIKKVACTEEFYVFLSERGQIYIHGYYGARKLRRPILLDGLDEIIAIGNSWSQAFLLNKKGEICTLSEINGTKVGKIPGINLFTHSDLEKN